MGNVLTDIFPRNWEDRSRSYIQKLIKENHVTVNQKPVKANYRLSLGDRVEIDLPEAKEPVYQA